MNKNQERLFFWVGAFLATAVLTLGGCASEGSIKPAGLEQKIETARTYTDHQKLAAVYEQQAQDDKASAKRHQRLAEAYKRGWTTGGGQRGVGVPSGNSKMTAHCDNLARIYQQAADENLELAKEHHQMANEIKD